MATVSRVLNGKGPVSAPTRQRVLAAIERIGYLPNGAARSLITRQTRTIGVLLPDVHGEFFSELIRGIDLAARRAGFHLLVSGSHSELAETEAVLRALHGRVDGLILMTPGLDGERLRRSLPRRLPVVLLNHAGPDWGYDVLRVDNSGGARAVVAHLIGLGHRRLAMLTGPADNADAVERLRGFREGLAKCQTPGVEATELAGDFSEEAGYRAGLTLAEMRPRPTAVFAANDAMAIGCLSALRERGLEVPHSVAIAGFDDIPIARFVTPPLTSVRVAIAELGDRAMARLLRALAGQSSELPLQELIPTRLVVRSSCGAAATTQPEGG